MARVWIAPEIVRPSPASERPPERALHMFDRALRRHCCASDPWRATPSKRANLVFGSDDGYERDVFGASIAIVEQSHFEGNGAGFSIDDAHEIDRRNARALWH